MSDMESTGAAGDPGAVVLYERTGTRGQIALVTLNRPRQANAVVPGLARGLRLAVDRANADPEVSCAVLTGAGKHFCAGADLDELQRLIQAIDEGKHPPEPFNGVVRLVQEATQAIFRSPKPVIAAINGAATSGGLDIASACAYRVASTRSRLGETYVKLGLPPMNGGAWLLPRLVGAHRAFWIMASGDLIDSARALEIGLVDEVVEPEQVLPTALARAELLADRPPSVIRYLKDRLFASPHGTLEDAMAQALVHGAHLAQGEEHRQALQQLWPVQAKPPGAAPSQ